MSVRWRNTLAKPHHQARSCVGHDGWSYQSELERDYFDQELSLLLRAGEIEDLHRQTRVHLATLVYLPPETETWDGPVHGRAVYFKTDFDFLEPPNPVRVYVDTKGGHEEAAFRRNCRLWAAHGPGILRVVVDATHGRKRHGIRARRFVVAREIRGGERAWAR